MADQADSAVGIHLPEGGNEGTRYRCACGKPGFVDVGESAIGVSHPQAEGLNRYPCYQCFLRLVKERTSTFGRAKRTHQSTQGCFTPSWPEPTRAGPPGNPQ